MNDEEWLDDDGEVIVLTPEEYASLPFEEKKAYFKTLVRSRLEPFFAEKRMVIKSIMQNLIADVGADWSDERLTHYLESVERRAIDVFFTLIDMAQTEKEMEEYATNFPKYFTRVMQSAYIGRPT